MLPSYEILRDSLKSVLMNKAQQGHDIDNLYEELKALPDSYDAMFEFAFKISSLPMIKDWPYVEPNKLEEIWSECDPSRSKGLMAEVDLEDSRKRVEAAFYGSICGCMLGKPIEEYPHPDLYEIKEALEKTGEWPLDDYLSEEFLQVFGRRNVSWKETIRETIRYVAPDDDITYTIIGMLLLEKHGLGFTQEDIRTIWLDNLPIQTTWGPERTLLLKSGIHSLISGYDADMEEWGNILNPGDELCGALIRADAYGYACPGRPELAAELAWRDASWTHRRTGIYGTMFVAAAIAAAQVVKDPMEIFEVALKFVPMKSRFYKIASDSLNEVGQAKDWLDGYARIHNKYEEYTACQVYQEVGTLINTLRFAENIHDGFCKQVCQGNDTDSFGATAGSILGAYFGPGFLDPKWLKPLNDDIYTTMSDFRERKLSNVAKRMGQLPFIVAEELNTTK